MPQGGIDPGEAPLDAAIRELYEETEHPLGLAAGEAEDGSATTFPRR
jgi:putative (di)nucleoside polyphosphate hydrolase